MSARSTLLIVAAFALVLGLVQERHRTPPKVFCRAGEDGAERLVMLATSWCPYCARARGYLERHDIDYCEYDVETSPRGAALYREAGGRAVPVFLRGGAVVTGFDVARLDALTGRGADR